MGLALVESDSSGGPTYSGPDLQLGVGLQKHFTRRFGMGGRIFVAGGPWRVTVHWTAPYGSDCTDSSCEGSATESQGRFIATLAEHSLIIGPLGRFFISPLTFAGYYHFTAGGEETAVDASYHENTTSGSGYYSSETRQVYVEALDDGVVYGIGSRFGFFLGAEEQTELSATGRVGMLSSAPGYLYLEIGLLLGFAFAVGG
jgi:hypothetical protein